jgi:hypothetical protein
VKYKVRNKDGELEYDSFQQLEDAARLGFVDPDDELLREGETEWKKVSTQPALMKGKRGGLSAFNNPLVRWISLSVAGAIFAFWAIHRGSTQDKPELYAAGLTAAFLCVGVLFKVTADAAKRRR